MFFLSFLYPSVYVCTSVGPCDVISGKAGLEARILRGLTFVNRHNTEKNSWKGWRLRRVDRHADIVPDCSKVG